MPDLVPLSFETIRDVDYGRIVDAFNDELKSIYDDVQRRPNVKKARKVTLEIILEPKADDTGLLDTVEFGFTVKSNAPKRESAVYRAIPSKAGILFQPLTPDNPNQSPLPFNRDQAEGN